jgi:hypothetical protein
MGMTVFKVCTGSVLVDDVWHNPETYDADETAVLCDHSATSATGGTTIWKGIVRSDAVMAGLNNNLGFYLTESDIVTIFIQNLVAVGQTSVSVRWTEEW